MKTFMQFLEDKGMEGMSVKGGHKRTVKQGAGLTKRESRNIVDRTQAANYKLSPLHPAN